MNFSFAFADKSKLDSILPDIFSILHSNMSIIVPTGNSYEQDFEEWYKCIAPAMQKERRNMVLMLCDNKIAGYFQYYITSDLLMMEEIQIKKEYQQSGLFRAFYEWLIKELPPDIRYVEAYSNKRNLKSQGILEHLGLKKIGLNKSGNSFHYRGLYSKLCEMFY